MFRWLARTFRSVDLAPLRWWDRYLAGRSAGLQASTRMPLIAVIGPPRVGSTLMYQLVAGTFRVYCFDNLQHTLLRYPFLGYRLSKWVCNNACHVSDLQSDHGYVSGLCGISEANYFWPYWCGLEMTQSPVKPDPHRLNHALRLMDRMFDDYGVPLANAYNPHVFYLRELMQYFAGGVVFVNLYRQPLEHALSILRARRRLRRDPRQWWSIQPRACCGMSGQDEYRQITCQLVETYRAVQEQRAALPQAKIIDVAYEQLCQDPDACLSQLEHCCAAAGIPLKRRIPAPVWKPLAATVRNAPACEDARRFQELWDGIDWPSLWPAS